MCTKLIFVTVVTITLFIRYISTYIYTYCNKLFGFEFGTGKSI